MGCNPDPLAVFKGLVSNLRGEKRNGRRWGGKEEPVKSVKPRARKGLYTPDVKSTKSEVRRASIIRKSKKGKEKRTETA